MQVDKNTVLRSVLPPEVKEMDHTQINLDSTDLSLPDILRNLNKLYPVNTRNRNRIQDGEMVLSVLCKTETLYPYAGLLIIIGKKDLDIDITSKDYIVFTIAENRIVNDLKISSLIDDITQVLISKYQKNLKNLPDFYRKYVYDETEMYLDEDYQSDGY